MALQAFLFFKGSSLPSGGYRTEQKSSPAPSLSPGLGQVAGRRFQVEDTTWLKKAEQVWERTTELVKREKVFATFWGAVRLVHCHATGTGHALSWVGARPGLSIRKATLWGISPITAFSKFTLTDMSLES